MCLSGLRLRAAALAILSAGSLCLSLPAQTVGASAGTRPELGRDIPKSIPSPLPPHHKNTDQPLIYARVRDGIFSVDGMVGRVALNYDVKAANFLYLFVPGVGTALVTLSPTPDSLWTISTYQDQQLTLTAGDHVLNLTGVESLLNDRGKTPAHLYVRLDRDTWRLSHTPMVGFGKTSAAPYEWPGSLPGHAATAQPAHALHPAPQVPTTRRISFEIADNSRH